MITFWFVCAALIAIALAFVLPSLFSNADKLENGNAADRRESNIAVYRDQLSELDADLRNGIISADQHAQDHDEIERRLLEDVSDSPGKSKSAAKAVTTDRGFAYLFAMALCASAIVLYLRIGDLPAMSGAPTASTSGPASRPSGNGGGAPGGMTQEQIEKNVAGLAKRLEGNPNDLQGWLMLARSYSSMEKYQEAGAA